MVVFNFAGSCGVSTWIERRPSCVGQHFWSVEWTTQVRLFDGLFGLAVWSNVGRAIIDIQMILRTEEKKGS
jgi:hypothetical protein